MNTTTVTNIRENDNMKTLTEREWTFFYDTEWIQRQVENITTTIAGTPVGKNGERRMWLAMNEDHSDLFQRFVKDALSDIRTACRKWVEPEHGSDDMRRVDRLHLHTKLWLPEAEEVPALVRVIDDKIREFLIWRVIYLWMQLKAPDEAAAIYLPKSAEILEQLKELFRSAGGGTARRYYHLY